jgi:hypothetical protein
MSDWTLMIAAGDVLDVQLTSETVVIDTPMGRRPAAEPGHITNRMRLFVKDLDSKEQVFDFEETELGVRETQRVAIVRAKEKEAPAPINLMLFNLSSGQHDTFEPGIAAYLARKRLFGPGLKATLIALIVGVIFWLVSHYGYGRNAASASFLAGSFACLLMPALWWLLALWDRITERMRFKAARKRFITETTARVQAHAPRAAAA